MAQIKTWRAYAGAWGGESNTTVSGMNVANQGTGGLNATLLKIDLNALGAEKKRNLLEVEITLLCSWYQNGLENASSGYTRDTVFVTLTNQGKNSNDTNMNPVGTTITSVNINPDNRAQGVAKTFKLNLNISSLNKNAQTVYLYLLPRIEPHIYYTYYLSSASVKEVTADDITAVTTNKLTNSTNNIFLPSDTVRVSWNAATPGINNTIAGYDVFLRVGAAPTTSNYTLKASTTSTSYNFSITNIARGSAIYVGVQAKGTKSGYDGALEIQSAPVGKINILPPAPTYRSSGTILNSSTSIEYNIDQGRDSDNQTLSLYYSLNGASKVSCSTTLVLNLSELFKEGTNTIVFYNYDGKEYSVGSASHSFQAIFKPVIKTVSQTHTFIKNMNNNSNSLVSNTSITFTLSSGSSKSISLYVRQGSGNSLSGDGILLPSSEYTYNNSTKTLTIPITKISNNYINPGNFFQFCFIVSDGTNTSDKTSWQSIGQRPKFPKLTTLNNFSTDKISTEAMENYYREKITVQWTNPSADAVCAAISSIKILALYENSSLEFNCPTATGSFSQDLELTSVTRGVLTSFKFRITDVAGQTIESEIFAKLYKASLVNFSGKIDLSHTELFPLSNTEGIVLSHPAASASGTKNIKYNYKITMNNSDRFLEEGQYVQTSSSNVDTITIEINDRDLIETIFLGLAGSNKNTYYEAAFVISAIDGFGQAASLQKTGIKIDFREKPILPDSDFSIRHDFDIGSDLIGILSNPIGEEVKLLREQTWNDTKNNIMFNSGEGIVFIMPQTEDLNDDVFEYRIYLSRNTVIDSDISNILPSGAVEFQPTPFITIPYKTLLDKAQDKNKLVYKYKASQYIENEYFYFKLQAVDSTGNVSNSIICPNCIIGCRTTSPQISVDNLQVNRTGTTVKLNYEAKITDLGGSANKLLGWNEDFYQAFPNFERIINNYSPHINLRVEISPVPEFTSIIAGVNTYDIGEFLKFIDTSITLQGFDTKYSKIFIRFTAEVTYGIDSNSPSGYATVLSVPVILTYFDTVPTVAHRANHLGINTKSFESEEVLVIENYSNRKKIVLKGTSGTFSNTIVIDLSNGSITGALLDGGDW